MFKRMSPSQSSLWNRLEAFTIGDPEASLGFAQRLARDSNWSLAFARRVIEEYKKFLFLAMEAGHPVTPSDEVDQAWHLHLVYTESYWNELCRDILPRPLHHGPTKGGKREGDKFNDWYAKTLRSYERFFGQAPPADIWPAAAVRFGLAPHFRRINVAENYIIPKRFTRIGMTAGACAAATLLVGCGLTLGPGDSALPIIVFAFFALVFVALVIRGFRQGWNSGSSSCGSSGCTSGWLWFGGSDSQSHHDSSHGSGSGHHHGSSGCSSHHGHSGCNSSHGDGGSSGCSSSGGDSGGSGCGSSGCGGGGCGGGGCGGS